MKDTKENFIRKAQKIHGDKYDYSKVNYIDSKTKICIICPKHGEFWQTPSSHLMGCSCRKCHIEKLSEYKRSNTEDFIIKAQKIHGDKYDYSKVNYIKSNTKVCIICPKHGEFFITPNNFLRGNGCLKCYDERRGDTQRDNTENFIKKAKNIHKNTYDYSKVNYINCSTPVCIICPKHGEFWQRPDHHLSSKCGCPKCNESHLETKICELLKQENIRFTQQQKFEWLKNTTFLYLDFYLPDYNIAIECQGRQHFCFVSHFGGDEEYLKTTKRDIKKINLCKENNVEIYYFGDKKYKNECLNEHYYSNKHSLINDIKSKKSLD